MRICPAAESQHVLAASGATYSRTSFPGLCLSSVSPAYETRSDIPQRSARNAPLLAFARNSKRDTDVPLLSGLRVSGYGGTVKAPPPWSAAGTRLRKDTHV